MAFRWQPGANLNLQNERDRKRNMFVKLYLVTLPVFFLIDMIWLGLIAKKFYRSQIGFLLKNEVNWIAAITFYLLFIFGLVYFVILPALDRREWSYALLNGVVFGLITYATYDLTNLATVKDWPVLVTVVDMLWGMILAGTVSTVSYFIAVKLGLSASN